MSALPRRAVLTTFVLLLSTLPLPLTVTVADASLAPASARPAGEWPLSPTPRVVAGFDPPAVRWGAGHRGVDLAGSAGQRVHAALGGTVLFAAPIAGRGVVVVDHGGRRTTYQPVAASVRAGDVVGAGAPIGRLQLFGSHCLPTACLHWGLVVGSDYRDPLGLVGWAPVRLLPLSAPAQLRVSDSTGIRLPAGGPAPQPVAPAVVGWHHARGWAWR